MLLRIALSFRRCIPRTHAGQYRFARYVIVYHSIPALQPWNHGWTGDERREPVPSHSRGGRIEGSHSHPGGTRRCDPGVARVPRPNGRYWRPHFVDNPRKRNRAFLPHRHDRGDCSATALEDARAVCAERGVRLTPARRRVLEIIWRDRRPLGACEIPEVLSREGYCPSPPTVYRALEFPVSRGLVHRLPFLNALIGRSRPGHPGAALQ